MRGSNLDLGKCYILSSTNSLCKLTQPCTRGIFCLLIRLPLGIVFSQSSCYIITIMKKNYLFGKKKFCLL